MITKTEAVELSTKVKDLNTFVRKLHKKYYTPDECGVVIPVSVYRKVQDLITDLVWFE